MKRVVVLAMHGAPPRDLPPQLLAEFMTLHAQAGHSKGHPSSERLRELERQVRAWPRTPENDPFRAASLDLGRELQAALGVPVHVAFNEFCDPEVEHALEEAAKGGPEEIVIVTPMLTPGGEHAELDIPAAIERSRTAHPQVRFVYAWPIPLRATAAFLADHIHLALQQPPV